MGFLNGISPRLWRVDPRGPFRAATIEGSPAVFAHFAKTLRSRGQVVDRRRDCGCGNAVRMTQKPRDTMSLSRFGVLPLFFVLKDQHARNPAGCTFEERKAWRTDREIGVGVGG